MHCCIRISHLERNVAGLFDQAAVCKPLFVCVCVVFLCVSTQRSKPQGGAAVQQWERWPHAESPEFFYFKSTPASLLPGRGGWWWWERGWGWGEVGDILLDQIIKTEIRAMCWKSTEPAQGFSWASHSHCNKKKPINGVVHLGKAVINPLEEIFESYEGNYSFFFSSYFYVTAFCALFIF